MTDDTPTGRPEALEDLNAAAAVLREIIEERGHDFVYRRVLLEMPSGVVGTPHPGCVNFTADGTPSCIVGRWLSIVDPPTFARAVEGGIAFQSSDALGLLKDLGYFGDEFYTVRPLQHIVTLLLDVQSSQDLAEPYGALLPRIDSFLAAPYLADDLRYDEDGNAGGSDPAYDDGEPSW